MTENRPSAACPAELLEEYGFAFMDSGTAAASLGLPSGWQNTPDWLAFRNSWNDLPGDGYMADGGVYRQRRHAVLVRKPGACWQAEPGVPHFQSRAYNSLNGGVARYYQPVAADILRGRLMTALLEFGGGIFHRLRPAAEWKAEIHQFRILAGADAPGKPTPEGIHRDGVDFVLMALVARENVQGGESSVFGADDRLLQRHTLALPLDIAMVDDHRVLHGVSDIWPRNPECPGYRDILVITFRSRRQAEPDSVPAPQ